MLRKWGGVLNNYSVHPCKFNRRELNYIVIIDVQSSKFNKDVSMKSKSALLSSTILLSFMASFQTIAAIKASQLADYEDDKDKIIIEPEITVADNTLKPKIIFRDKIEDLFSDNAFFPDLHIQFAANSGLKVGDFEDPINSAEQIITEFVADGGNLELNAAFAWQAEQWAFVVGGYYLY